MAKPRADCGTTAGYQQHRLRGEPVCDACRLAWTEYFRARRLGLLPPIVPTGCATCGQVFTPSRRDASFCSQQCRDKTPPRVCRFCGVEFVRVVSFPVCADCSDIARRERYRRKNRKRRAGRAGDYTLAEIAERDGWRCHLCCKAVSSKYNGMHPKGPTIDHLVPVSAGGVDERENVALAHRDCNVRRSNHGPAQLRLIA
jgi:hypothetical protein